MTETARTMSVLIHGLTKVGKSTIASTAPKPLLYIDVEGRSRFLPLKRREWKPLEEAPPICTDDDDWDTAVVTCRTYKEAEQAYLWLNSGQHCFRSVAVDSVSELQQRLIDQIGNRDQLEQRGWGEVFRTLMGFVRDMHGLTLHPSNPLTVVFIGMSKEGTDGKYHPFAQGQSKNIMPYIVDVIAAMEIATWVDPTTGERQKAHRLTTGPHHLYETGEGVGGRIPQQLDNASIPLLLDYVYGVEPSAAPTPATSTPETPAE